MTFEELSYKHYKEWFQFENEPASKVILGAFAVVRGLLRIPFEDGNRELTYALLNMIEKDIQDFKDSLGKPNVIRSN